MLAGGAGGQASNGLVAEYHFDGDANDSSGGGNHGTINGALFVTGVSEQALSFDGVDDYVEISKYYKFTATLTYGSNTTSSEAAFTIRRR